VGQGVIDERRPEDRKDQEGGKLHPFRKGADHQGRSDHGEHTLKDHEDAVRDRGGVIAIGLPPHMIETRPLQTADNPLPRIGTEGQGITEQDPLEGDYAHDDEALHEDGKDIFPADQPSVKEGQSRDGHGKDEDRG